MKQVKMDISARLRQTTREDVTLNSREILAFVHNAQLALLELIDDKDIPTLYFYTENLHDHFLTHSKLSRAQAAAVLVSTAYKLIEKA